MEKLNSAEASASGIARNLGSAESCEAIGFYTVECVGADGQVKWREEYQNLVVTVGKNFILDTVLSGSGYTNSISLGLVNGATTPTYAATDTMASHAGWTEFVNYSNGTRYPPTFASASAGSKATSSAAGFTINSTGGTVAGTFLVSGSNAINGTTGTLISVGSFSGGNRTVIAGDTLNVSYTLSV
jgi:hypothetical protein